MPETRFPTPAGDLPGYLAEPVSAGPWPGVVVIHEVFGLDDDIRQSADRLAAAGYLALAPDLYTAPATGGSAVPGRAWPPRSATPG